MFILIKFVFLSYFWKDRFMHDFNDIQYFDTNQSIHSIILLNYRRTECWMLCAQVLLPLLRSGKSNQEYTCSSCSIQLAFRSRIHACNHARLECSLAEDVEHSAYLWNNQLAQNVYRILKLSLYLLLHYSLICLYCYTIFPNHLDWIMYQICFKESIE